jgi:hypothetical protein
VSVSHILSKASLDALGCKFWIPLVKNGRDYSGSNFNGTVTGPTLNRMETGNPCLHFDGADDRVSFGNIMDNVFMTNTFTVSAWIKLNSYTDHNNYESMIVQKWYTSSSSANAFILRPHQFFTQGAYIDVPKEDIPLHEWVFVTAVIDNGDMYLYHNCILVASGTGGYCNNCNFDMRIGSLHNNHYDFDGDISNVMIFDQALSITNINRLYAATRMVPDRIW